MALHAPSDLLKRWSSKRSILAGSCASILWLTGVVPALADVAESSEPPYQLGPDLVEPLELCPEDNGVLDVTMEVRSVEHEVDHVDANTHVIKKQKQVLRAYHLQPETRAKVCGGSFKAHRNPMIPGPTFRLRKSDRGTLNGSRFRLKLTNNLTLGQPPWACNSVSDFKAPGIHPIHGECRKADFPEQPQTWPACFHGDNVTNFHYHGFHISPQSPQDNVLLEIKPGGGTFQYELDPIPYTQAEGTHWYHPHKHGSTALQVLNGMAGTFVIEGPFDDWLDGFYDEQGHPLEDKVLVVQQIDQGIEFYKRFDPVLPYKIDADGNFIEDADGNKIPCGAEDPDSGCACYPHNTYNPPHPTVNGHVNPVITMRPGEIQRWRFVGATMQASGHLSLGFDEELEIYQIAQDGVQFAEANYKNQPFMNESVLRGVGREDDSNFLLAPGNRADFLVRAPLDAEPGSLFFLTHDVAGFVHEDVRAQLDARDARAMGFSKTEHLEDPPLLSIRIAGTPRPMRFPHRDAQGRWQEGGRYASEWPPMPDFLADLGAPQKSRRVEFSMGGTETGQVGNRFYIAGVQYCPDCANYTMELGSVEEWRIVNSSTPNHPFHIHVNPFQLRKVFGVISPKPGTTTIPMAAEYDPPIWQDVVALPAPGCVDVPAPKSGSCDQACARWGGRKPTADDDCDTPEPGSCACYAEVGYAEVRQKFIDFTGEYVIHCHILGHEDRGMMLNVQTICPRSASDSGDVFGTPTSVLGEVECGPTNALQPAALECLASYATGPECAKGATSSSKNADQGESRKVRINSP